MRAPERGLARVEWERNAEMRMRGVLTAVAAALALLATAAAASGGAKQHHQPAGLTPRLQVASVPRYAATPSLTFDSSYESLINRYFGDVAAASAAHSTSDVYSVATQYSSIQYHSVVGGQYVDHHALPANGCDDGVDSYCLTDQQLQDEIQNVLTAKGWHGGLSNMFFLMTPVGVGSCVDAFSGICSTNYFCAYHNDFVNTNGEDVIYANEPYEGQLGGCDGNNGLIPPGPGFGFPNDQDSDTTINTISHEHIEAITDPLGTAWYADDGNGDEIGDLCAYYYGPKAGTAANGQPYSQKINGNDYSLQEEYSNIDGGCVPSLGAKPASPETFGSGPLNAHGGPVMLTNTTYAIYWLPVPGDTAAPALSGTSAVNQTLTSTAGTWNGDAASFSYQWQRCSAAGTGCANIPGAGGPSYSLTSADGGSRVRSTVSATNVNGASAYAASATSAVVSPVPAATAGPVVSGAAGVGRSLATTSGSWNTAASFAYQWLRCAANGTGCAAIPAATAGTYPLVAADAGHRLEAVVSATNAAGTGSATSAATAVIVAVPAATAAPRIAGKAGVHKRLSARHGTWTWSPTGYRYQWLRCSAHGGRCAPIKKATHATYRVARKDAGHRLRLRVTATNAAGAHSASSRPTRLVRGSRRS